jgi:oligoribonuclease
MDLEMTGLDPSRHVIVEIATLVTDDELRIVAEGPDLVVSASPAELAQMSDVVREMHQRSGLLAAIQGSKTSLAEAGRRTLEFLEHQLPERGTVPLAGNSIGTDRRFLAAQLPEIEQWFHYRSIDVSTIKELTKRWYPGILSGAPQKRGTHRAMDDIKESVAELSFYRESVFCTFQEVVNRQLASPLGAVRQAHDGAHSAPGDDTATTATGAEGAEPL